MTPAGLETVAIADPDALACGCRWRRDETYGDVIDQCAEHRAEIDLRTRGPDASIAAQARLAMDRDLDRAVRRGRR